jgi:hypothetical protein
LHHKLKLTNRKKEEIVAGLEQTEENLYIVKIVGLISPLAYI